jgi:hypothetical protein
MITSVIPIAMMLMTAVCRATVERLSTVRKYGERMERRRKRTNKVRKGSSFLRRSFMSGQAMPKHDE